MKVKFRVAKAKYITKVCGELEVDLGINASNCLKLFKEFLRNMEKALDKAKEETPSDTIMKTAIAGKIAYDLCQGIPWSECYELLVKVLLGDIKRIKEIPTPIRLILKTRLGEVLRSREALEEIGSLEGELEEVKDEVLRLREAVKTH